MTQDARAIEAPEGAEGLMQEYAMAEAKYEQARDEMRAVKEALLAQFPANEIGRFEMAAGKWTTTVKVPGRVEWDSEELAAYYGADMPPHLSRKLSINEAHWKSLPIDERAALNGARELKCGSASIDVEVSLERLLLDSVRVESGEGPA